MIESAFMKVERGIKRATCTHLHCFCCKRERKDDISGCHLIPFLYIVPPSIQTLPSTLTSPARRFGSSKMAFIRSYSNASSGMGVADQCKQTFLELQRKKMHKYVVFKIDEKRKEVIVEKTGGAAETYDDFLAALPEADCRYAVYDFDFVTHENCQKSKIFFVAWSPSVSRIRSKMLYAASKDRFRRELDGVHYEIQATDPTEVDLEVLQDRAN